MRRKGLESGARNERGAVIVFVLVVMVFLLMIGGLAVDYAHMFVADKELEKSVDAAALAAAGKLGFTSDEFPTARQFAQEFANRNSYRVGTVTLSNNPSNDPALFNAASAPYGDVIFGIWDPDKPQGVGPGLRFEPSLDGTIVNAAMCRFKTQIPTSLFRLWGINTMSISATAIATSNPPANPPPDGCLFPIGVGDCPFQGNTSLGCGAPISFITSSGKDDEGAGCLAPPCTNTSAWVNLEGGNVNTPYLQNAIQGAANGSCPTTEFDTGDTIPAGNGMNQSVMDVLEAAFTQKYNESAAEPVTIRNAQNEIVYEGQGWKVFIPVLDTECPAAAITGDQQIIGWTEFVMTQVINKGKCAVANHWSGNAWDPLGSTPNCTATNQPSNPGALRAVFGYYSCTLIPVEQVPRPLPRSALGTKLRLVQ
jgi:hypothetical protein